MTKLRRRRKIRKHIGSLAIAGVMLMMMLFVFFAGEELRAKNAGKQVRIEELNAQKAAEEQKAEEIEEYGKYVQTKKFAEEYAIEHLGLVYEDWIIFKAKPSIK